MATRLSLYIVYVAGAMEMWRATNGRSSTKPTQHFNLNAIPMAAFFQLADVDFGTSQRLTASDENKLFFLIILHIVL